MVINKHIPSQPWPPPPSEVSFRGDWYFLSNFFPCKVEYNGRIYGNAEAAYQAAKFPNHSEQIQKEFCFADAATAKRLGHTYSPIRHDWPIWKNQVMRDVLSAKFYNPDLRAALLSTGSQHLKESNDWGDRYWGTVDGQGLNTLGVLLMDLRAEIRDAQSPKSDRAYEVLKRLVLHSMGSWFKGEPTLENLEAAADEIIECSYSTEECMPVWQRRTREELLNQLAPYLSHLGGERCEYGSLGKKYQCTCGLDEVIKNSAKEIRLIERPR